MGTTKATPAGIERTLARCYQFQRDALATRIDPDAVYTLAPHWHGHAVWARLARAARDYKIDPVRYVRWCLELGRVYPGPPPEPNQLLQRDAMRAYREELPKARAGIALHFRIETEAAKTRFAYRHKCLGDDYEKACLMTLAAGDLQVSPLFRFVLARTIGTQWALEIAENHEQNALYVFSKNPEEYGAVYGASGHLPADFAAAAAAYYDALIRAFDEQYAGGKL